MTIQTVTDAIRYVGVDDNTLALFENQYPVQPMGVSYNSYVILDEKIAVMDSVDARAAEEWLSNVARVLEGRRPDYLVVTHMEPDHSGSLMRLAQKYPEMKIVGNAKTFTMIKQFFGTGALSEERMLEVGEGSTISLGSHRLRFLLAPMVLKHNGYRYQFSPYALIWSRDCYYAVGWSEKHGKLAQFRVDRMVAVKSSDQAAVCMPDFDPAEYVRKIFGMYPDDLCTVELLCENEVMRSVIDRFGEEVSTVTADDGHFKAIVEVAPSPPFFAWVFTFCGKIQILGPAEVLDEMRGMAAWLQ